MATFNLVNTLMVETFEAEFNRNFGATLKIYSGGRLADMSATLKDVGLTKESIFECRSSLTVASFIKRMNEEFGISVKVFTCDAWVAVLDGLTLESAGKVKRQAVKADMESMLAYQGQSDCDDVPSIDNPVIDFAIFQSYTINRRKSGSIEIIGGNFKNTKEGLRTIASKANVEIHDDWNTQYMGWYIIKQLSAQDSVKPQTDPNGTSSSFSKCKSISESSFISESDSQKESNNMKELVRQIFEVIARCELDLGNVSLESADISNPRVLISSLFRGTFSKARITLCLTVIDSFYSTNSAYSYFSIEEMADKIYSLGGNVSNEKKQDILREYLYGLVYGKKDSEQIFTEKYGIQKNLSEGYRQMSLLSKYAYYELMQNPGKYPLGFPIYDKLAKKAYPVVANMLGIDGGFDFNDNVSIEDYISGMQKIRRVLFDDFSLYLTPNGAYQQFDILDAYLWRIGKFDNGNLSLLMSREDYVRFIKNIGLNYPQNLNKEEIEVYHSKMLTLYNNINPGSTKYDFNEIVSYCLEHCSSPFNGLTAEKYLNTILIHWKIFNKFAKNKL